MGRQPNGEKKVVGYAKSYLSMSSEEYEEYEARVAALDSDDEEVMAGLTEVSSDDDLSIGELNAAHSFHKQQQPIRRPLRTPKGKPTKAHGLEKTNRASGRSLGARSGANSRWTAPTLPSMSTNKTKDASAVGDNDSENDDGKNSLWSFLESKAGDVGPVRQLKFSERAELWVNRLVQTRTATMFAQASSIAVAGVVAIALIYTLLEIPDDVYWTQFALLIPALLIFVPSTLIYVCLHAEGSYYVFEMAVPSMMLGITLLTILGLRGPDPNDLGATLMRYVPYFPVLVLVLGLVWVEVRQKDQIAARRAMVPGPMTRFPGDRFVGYLKSETERINPGRYNDEAILYQKAHLPERDLKQIETMLDTWVEESEGSGDRARRKAFKSDLIKFCRIRLEQGRIHVHDQVTISRALMSLPDCIAYVQRLTVDSQGVGDGLLKLPHNMETVQIILVDCINLVDLNALKTHLLVLEGCPALRKLGSDVRAQTMRVGRCENFVGFPASLGVTKLELIKCPVKALPSGLVLDHLYLHQVPIKRLEVVVKTLILAHCSLERLPELAKDPVVVMHGWAAKFEPGQAFKALMLNKCPNIRQLPPGIRAERMRIIECSKMMQLGDELEIDDLTVRDCSSLRRLSSNLTCTTAIAVTGCHSLSSLAHGLTPTSFFVEDCPLLRTLPSDLEAEQLMIHACPATHIPIRLLEDETKEVNNNLGLFVDLDLDLDPLARE
mmetsp:Transcript_15388/g.28271  ORF Transcript_15388/g.28271 Transcript_15388/m.28271 type:complete len:722 (-) Transcript_15388:196-2361(-)